MSWTAQALGLDQASSATEGPRAAWLAVLHTGSPRGLSEGALGREKAAKVKVLKLSPTFSSRMYTVLGLMFRFLINFELKFVYGIR